MSLMEVMLAIVVLVFGLGGIMDLYGRQVQGIGQARAALRADHLARCYLAQIEAAGYEGLRTRYLKESSEALFDDSPTREAALDPTLWWSARLERQAADVPPARIRITVVVGWGTQPSGSDSAAAFAANSKSRKAIGYVVAP
jgi:type II secretory pathway pseudopilin PulG